MFRNIFPKKTNRLVYMGLELVTHAEAEADDALLEAKQASPEGLKKQADQALGAINDDLNQLAERFDVKKMGDQAMGSREILDKLGGQELDKRVQDALVTYEKAVETLEEQAKLDKPGSTAMAMAMLDLNNARTSLKAYLAIADLDPINFTLTHLFREVPEAEKAAPGTIEAAPDDWVQMTRLAENYRDTDDAARKAQLGLRIIEMAQKQLAGSEGVREYAAGDTYLVVQPGEKGAYMFAYPMKIEGGKIQGWEHFALNADGTPAKNDQFKMSPDDLLEKYGKART